MALKPSKAKKILKEGMAHGKKLTGKQKRYMGLMAGGGKSQEMMMKKKEMMMS